MQLMVEKKTTFQLETLRCILLYNKNIFILGLDKMTHLYSFDSCFAEVSFHFNVDLHISNVTEDKGTYVLVTTMSTQKLQDRGHKRTKEKQIPDVEV